MTSDRKSRVLARQTFHRARLFSVLLIKRFRDDRCLATATGLSYTSLLSLVPLIAVVFSIVSLFPAFESAVDQMQEFIFQNFVPASGELVQEHVDSFVTQATRLTGIGIVFLVLTALILMNAIDNAINHIWRVAGRRSAIVKFAVYWAVLTLGPMLIAVSILMTSYLASLPQYFGADGQAGVGFGDVLIRFLPFLATMLALSLLYVVVPNCRVPVSYGLIGAGVAALLFEIAKHGFTFYVANVPTYATVYGALAIIPLFLVWVYVSWVIVLFGAQLVYCLMIFRVRRFRPVESRAVSNFIAAYRLLGHLWQGQSAGKAYQVSELSKLEPDFSLENMHILLHGLEDSQIVYRNEMGDWGLARDLDKLRLQDLYHAFPAPISEFGGDWVDSDDWNRALYATLLEGKESIDQAMDIPLKQLFQARSKAD